MVYTNTFKEDLIRGQAYEKKALKYLEYDTVEHMVGLFKEYDFIITHNNKSTKIEVKADFKMKATGNLAIEYECSKKPSGISCTEADYWMYFEVNKNSCKCYKIPIKDLRELISGCREVSGGNGFKARLYLLPEIKVKAYRVYRIN